MTPDQIAEGERLLTEVRRCQEWRITDERSDAAIAAWLEWLDRHPLPDLFTHIRDLEAERDTALVKLAEYMLFPHPRELEARLKLLEGKKYCRMHGGDWMPNDCSICCAKEKDANS